MEQSRHDYHVHSTWSDDAVSSLEENLAAAEQRGLATICLVEHVRTSSTWVPDFVAAADQLRTRPVLEVLIGVEAKLLDTSGTLDLPEGLTGLDHVLVADHQLPTPAGPCAPSEARRRLATGESTPAELIDGLIESTCGAVTRYERTIVAHLFSILPKIGLSEDDVPDRALAHLARRAAAGGAWVEVNEKWCCPNRRTLEHLARAGVPIVLSTDAHDCADVGRYHRAPIELDAALAKLAPAGAG